MNEIINKFLLTGDKFMSEIHLRQPGFTYSACGPFTENKQKIQRFMDTGDTKYIYRNELDKACFQHDMAYGDFKDSKRRTQSDKVLKVKAFEIASNPKCDGYQRGLASMVYKFFGKKSKGAGVKNESKENQQLANELHKPITKNLKKRKVYSSYKDNIWGIDLADMQLISKYNKGIRYLLCAIDFFIKYLFVVPLKDKKGVSIVNAFQKNLNNSKRKPNKIWVDQESEFYNTHFKKWLKDNNIEMYSTYNEGKSVVAERFVRTLKNKIYKHMIAISKNVCFDVLDNFVDKYNNTYHRTIQMKPVDVGDDSFAEYNEESNEKDPKFKIGDYVRVSKYKNIFAKGNTPNWSEEVFIIKRIENTVPWTYAISDLNGEDIVGSFYEKELQKTDQQRFRIEKVIKRKGNKFYVKWKGYNNSFNSWTDKKDLIK